MPPCSDSSQCRIQEAAFGLGPVELQPNLGLGPLGFSGTHEWATQKRVL